MNTIWQAVRAAWHFVLGFWRLLPHRVQQGITVLVLALVAIKVFPGFLQGLFCLLILALLMSFMVRAIRGNLGLNRRRHHRH